MHVATGALLNGPAHHAHDGHSGGHTSISSSSSSLPALYNTAAPHPTSSRKQSVVLTNPPPGIGRSGRTLVACTRCRRYRSRCLHGMEGKTPQAPCDGCIKANVPDECVFVKRGQSASDRQFRRRQAKAEGAGQHFDMGDHHHQLPPPAVDMPAPPSLQPSMSSSAEHSPPPSATMPPMSQGVSLDASFASRFGPPPVEWPPVDEMVDACKATSAITLQLGFMHPSFCDVVREQSEKVNPFFLAAILASHARLVPALCARYGSAEAASSHWSAIAESMLPNVIFQPSADHIRGCIMLGISAWGMGNGMKFYMVLGIAARMALVLRLHRESTYALPPDADPAAIIESETLRRTFYVLKANDQHLSSGSSRPPQFALQDVDTLLPADEDDFLFGYQPASRTPLPGSAADVAGAQQPTDKSFFAMMILAGELWSKVAQYASGHGDRDGDDHVKSLPPWDPSSYHSIYTRELDEFEASLPAKFRWSPAALRAYRTKQQERVFVANTVLIRVGYVVLCRVYSPQIAAAVDPESPPEARMVNGHVAPPGYWQALSRCMVEKVIDFWEKIDAISFCFDEGTPLVLIFCVWLAGDVAGHVARWPQLCPELSSQAQAVYVGAVRLLEKSATHWRLASFWLDALRKNEMAASTGAALRSSAVDTRTTDLGDGIYHHPESEHASPHSHPSSQIGPSPSVSPRDVLAAAAATSSSHTSAIRTTAGSAQPYAAASALGYGIGGTPTGGLAHTPSSHPFDLPGIPAISSLEPQAAASTPQDFAHLSSAFLSSEYTNPFSFDSDVSAFFNGFLPPTINM